MTSRLNTPEAHARRVASRAANIASTRPTTRPGSEATDLQPGDAVVARRSEPSTAVWSRYAGRKGWVASISTQTFENGTDYVEVGVSWTLLDDVEDMRTDTWFRADELVRASEVGGDAAA